MTFSLISKHPRIGNDNIIYRLTFHDARESICELGGCDHNTASSGRDTAFNDDVLSATFGLEEICPPP